MYECLISHLRECAKNDATENTFSEAANAIEMLLSEYTKAFNTIAKAYRDNQQDKTLRAYMMENACCFEE